MDQEYDLIVFLNHVGNPPGKRKMENVSVAFGVLEDRKKPSAAHKQVPLHMIYDIKMEFTRKARLLAEGCRIPNPVTSTYAGVVSR